MTLLPASQAQVVTKATQLPVSFAEAKHHLRVFHDNDDDQIARMLRQAVETAAGFTGRQFVTQTWQILFRDFPSGRILELPFPPVASVTHVKYYDVANALQTFSSGDYTTFFPDDAEGVIELDTDASWPLVYDRMDACEVEWVAGYGAPEFVPEWIKSGILLYLKADYDREAESDRMIEAAERLLMQGRVAAGV